MGCHTWLQVGCGGREAQEVTSQESAAESAASSESSVSSGQEEDTHAVLFTLEEYREYEPDTLAITEDVEDLLGLAVSKDLGVLDRVFSGNSCS